MTTQFSMAWNLFKKTEIRIGVLFSGKYIPKHATSGSSCVDLRANIEKDFTLNPGERALISTGISLALPEGLEAQIRPRSGLALKQGITVLNAPGTIDSDYRGEVGVILINISNSPSIISPGDKIAQMAICPSPFKVKWLELASLSDTERGSGGFGSTG